MTIVARTITPAALERGEAARYVAISESTLDSLQRAGEFPAPRKLSGRRVGYLVRELDAWLESRPVSDLLPPPNTGAPKPRQSFIALATSLPAA
jgi:prophage regulatory protein